MKILIDKSKIAVLALFLIGTDAHKLHRHHHHHSHQEDNSLV